MISDIDLATCKWKHIKTQALVDNMVRGCKCICTHGLG